MAQKPRKLSKAVLSIKITTDYIIHFKCDTKISKIIYSNRVA